MMTAEWAKNQKLVQGWGEKRRSVEASSEVLKLVDGQVIVELNGMFTTRV